MRLIIGTEMSEFDEKINIILRIYCVKNVTCIVEF